MLNNVQIDVKTIDMVQDTITDHIFDRPQFFFHFIISSHVWHQWKALLILCRMLAPFWLDQVLTSNKPKQKLIG